MRHPYRSCKEAKKVDVKRGKIRMMTGKSEERDPHKSKKKYDEELKIRLYAIFEGWVLLLFHGLKKLLHKIFGLCCLHRSFTWEEGRSATRGGDIKLSLFAGRIGRIAQSGALLCGWSQQVKSLGTSQLRTQRMFLWLCWGERKAEWKSRLCSATLGMSRC